MNPKSNGFVRRRNGRGAHFGRLIYNPLTATSPKIGHERKYSFKFVCDKTPRFCTHVHLSSAISDVCCYFGRPRVVFSDDRGGLPGTKSVSCVPFLDGNICV